MDLKDLVNRLNESVNRLEDTTQEMLGVLHRVASLALDLTSEKISWGNKTDEQKFYRTMDNYLDVAKICVSWLTKLEVLNRGLSKELEKLVKKD
jgi:hypothetical protein